ncbi:MAG: type II secretion system protein [Planctomycetota bacterium]|jgi:prepilin-type N-terminal cleavage/methylation domain-containing protein
MKRSPRAFTIVELLVVVSIIALLVGILLPAIGKARDQANVSKSQANLRNLMSAANTYAADWNDRQFTLTPDNLSKYGSDAIGARDAWVDSHGGDIFTYPLMELGLSPPNFVWFSGQNKIILPVHFSGDDKYFGWFRHPNCGQFNEYLTGRFYDPVFYPPKDKAAIATLEGCLDAAGEISDCDTGGQFTGSTEFYYPAGYSFSPAALMSADVLNADNGYSDFQDPWDLPSGWKAPGMSQARFPELKSMMLEHHWLQFAERDCNPNFGTDGIWDGCEPHYFNHGYKSTPVTLFYDGHIEGLGQYEAIQADGQIAGQDENGVGLWHRGIQGWGDNGYTGQWGFDWTTSSHHILTVNGIEGRDKTSE